MMARKNFNVKIVKKDLNQKSTFIINADQFKALSREYNKVVKNLVD